METLPQTVVSLFFLTSFIPAMLMSDLWRCCKGQGSGGRVLAEKNICLHKDNEIGLLEVLSGLCHN